MSGMDSFGGGMRERRGRLAADDRRGLVDELLVLEGLQAGVAGAPKAFLQRVMSERIAGSMTLSART